MFKSRVALIPLHFSLNQLALDISRNQEQVLVICSNGLISAEFSDKLIIGLASNQLISKIFLLTSGSEGEIKLIRRLPQSVIGNSLEILDLGKKPSIKEFIESCNFPNSFSNPIVQTLENTRLRAVIVGAHKSSNSDKFKGEASVLLDSICESLKDLPLDIEIGNDFYAAPGFHFEIVIDLSLVCNRFMNQAAGIYLSLKEVDDVRLHTDLQVSDYIVKRIRNIFSLRDYSYSYYVSRLNFNCTEHPSSLT